MKSWILALFVVSLVILSGCVAPKVCNTLSEEHLTFFQDYSIAMEDINLASSYYTTAANNLDIGNEYVQSGEYNYESALVYLDEGTAQLKTAETSLDEAKAKLSALDGKAPHAFFEVELDNRQDQADALILIVEDMNLLLSYSKQELYEINYGSKDKADAFRKLYNSVLPTLGSDLEKLAQLQADIDAHWSQNTGANAGQV